jgi:NTP pyrophosphatase (non-canonical NTP hydrolase)
VPTLQEIQQNALQLRHAKGWPDASPERRFLFLVEEVGERARVLQGHAGDANDGGGEKLFDVIWNVCDLANLLGLDLDAAAERKIGGNHGRIWDADAVQGR